MCGLEIILVVPPNIGNIQILINVSHVVSPHVIGASDKRITEELAEDRARVQLLYHGGLRYLVSGELLIPFEG